MIFSQQVLGLVLVLGLYGGGNSRYYHDIYYYLALITLHLTLSQNHETFRSFFFLVPRTRPGNRVINFTHTGRVNE